MIMLTFCIVQAKNLVREHFVAEDKTNIPKSSKEKKADEILNQIMSTNASLEVSFPIYRYIAISIIIIHTMLCTCS